MNKIFNFNKDSSAREENVSKSEKTTKELVEEIHENFFTEVDRLLANAKISKSLDSDKKGLIDKCERLKKLGFSNTKGVKEAEEEIERLDKIKKENEEKKDLIEAIDYFSFKYRQYKFITENSVLKICKKYNLVYGEVSRYKGDVPDKNLKHIEQFKIDLDDECFCAEGISFMKPVSYKEYLMHIEGKAFSPSFFVFNKCPLEIAAPPSDFDMEGMEVENFKITKIQIPDPVVLNPVFFKGKKHYLIVTAWGDEASDNMVVNEKMN